MNQEKILKDKIIEFIIKNYYGSIELRKIDAPSFFKYVEMDEFFPEFNFDKSNFKYNQNLLEEMDFVINFFNQNFLSNINDNSNELKYRNIELYKKLSETQQEKLDKKIEIFDELKIILKKLNKFDIDIDLLIEKFKFRSFLDIKFGFENFDKDNINNPKLIKLFFTLNYEKNQHKFYTYEKINVSLQEPINLDKELEYAFNNQYIEHLIQLKKTTEFKIDFTSKGQDVFKIMHDTFNDKEFIQIDVANLDYKSICKEAKKIIELANSSIKLQEIEKEEKINKNENIYMPFLQF